MKRRAALAPLLLAALPLGCQSPEPVVLSLENRVDRLTELDPVDVVVLPVSSSSPAIVMPFREMENAIRKQLLDKRYSVLAREAVLARTPPQAAGTPVSYRAGAAGEDAVLQVQVHLFEVPMGGPITKVDIEASFRLVGTDAAQTVFWERRNARAQIRTDSFQQKNLMTRGDVQVGAVQEYVQLVFRELPAKPRLSTLTESSPAIARPD